MRFTKKVARELIFPLTMKLQGDRILRTYSRNNALNIMYHGVVKEESNFFSPRHIDADQFEKHLQYFVKHFDILTLDEAFEIKQNIHKPKKKAIHISFDDGYVNNLTVVLPLLEKYKIKATFFISGICAKEKDDQILWSDVIAGLHYFYKDKTVSVLKMKIKNSIDIDTGRNLYDFMKSLPPEDRDHLLSDIIANYDLKSKIKNLPEEIWRMMNLEELQKLNSSDLVQIGSHGYLHYNLSEVPLDFAEKEMSVSKQILESNLNINITSIAFPDGSYNENVKDKAEEMGYQHLMAVNYKCTDDPGDYRILNRHGVSGTTTFESNMLMLNKSFVTKGF